MAWQRVVAFDALCEGAMQQFPRSGGELLICRTDGEVYALNNECPHSGGPLGMGNFSPPWIACPWHAWEFDCRTGECGHVANAKVATYPVEIRDGQVWVYVPEPQESGSV